MAFRWRADVVPILKPGFVALCFLGVRIDICKKHYSFATFQVGGGGGGGPDVCPPTLDPRMQFFSTQKSFVFVVILQGLLI